MMLKLLSKIILAFIAIALVMIGTVDSTLALEQKNSIGSSSAILNQDRTIILASVWDTKTESNYPGKLNMTVYRSPDCSCCGAWLEHIKKHGFEIEDFKTEQMEALKQKYNVSPDLASCHTAIIDGYVIEGHVPANDIKRFLQEKPQLTGLTVPGMPLGTPGMEMGDKKQPFQVLAFDKEGKTQVFSEYQAY